ncbi:MAG: leucyl aminopeptidase family protein, partial [Pseudomonadota bacterium]
LGSDEARRRNRFVLGNFAKSAPEGAYRLASPLPADDALEAALGWHLGRYRFTRYKSSTESQATLAPPDGVDPARLDALVAGSVLARDLINTPARDMGPDDLEAAARTLAEAHGATVNTISGEELQREFPLIHTVGQAAARPPRLIDLTWGIGPSVTLVGKGVCFDTGGLNLKPANGMGLMKKDMGGAANVLALAHMVMARRLPVRLRVLIPAVENAVSGSAMRPGDVLPSRKGLTVEVNNTDAEGRLVLADALALACEEAPELLLDFATLTGAARVALGPDLPPFYTDDDGLAADLAEGARALADPLWRMPLWPGYETEIEPDIADIDNAPSGGMAGSITAALFLKRFVDLTAWVHVDLYGWVPKPLPGRPKGGECQAARAAFHMLEKRYG